MIVEWYLNDLPVITGSRIRSSYDFGFISMDIKGVIPEDSGTYSVRAKSALGEDVRQCQVIITGKDSILSTTQHEDSYAKIQYLESLNKYGREEIEEHGPDVRFKNSLNCYLSCGLVFRVAHNLFKAFQVMPWKLRKVNPCIWNARSSQ